MTTQLIEEPESFLEERGSIDLKTRLKEIAIGARNLAMSGEEAFRKITSLYSESKSWEKQIEFIRKQANEPDQERINYRNDKAREILNPLKEIQSIAKEKTSEYQKILEEAKKKEQEQIEQAIDLLGIDEMPFIAPMDKSIRGDGAILYNRTIRKFRIVDQSKIPMKYLKVDEDAINRDIRLGVGEIEGVEIFEEQITQLRTR